VALALRRLPAASLLLAAACSLARPGEDAAPPPRPAVRILGAAQDAGLPQLLCPCRHCREARVRPRPEHRVTALAILGRSGRWWLVDATPDLPAQVEAMGSLPAGILLTHAHMGHMTGLLWLGREAVDARDLPLYCSSAMARLLAGNAPWRLLLELGELRPEPFRSGAPLELEAGLTVTPLRVPHRDEFADTHGFLVAIEGGGSLLYVPDVDRWEDWDRDLGQLAVEVDWLLLDGTFFAAGELPGRDPAEIPHPTVRHSMDLLQEVLAGGRSQVLFTHLNHSNPLWDPDSPASRELRARGFGTALDREWIPLGPPRP